MTEPLIFNSLTHISITDPAARANLSTSYLARLARTGRLRGRMVARVWFIELHSLQQFLRSRATTISYIATDNVPRTQSPRAGDKTALTAQLTN